MKDFNNIPTQARTLFGAKANAGTAAPVPANPTTTAVLPANPSSPLVMMLSLPSSDRSRLAAMTFRICLR